MQYLYLEEQLVLPKRKELQTEISPQRFLHMKLPSS